MKRYGELQSRSEKLLLFLILPFAVALLVTGSCLMTAIRTRSRPFQFAEAIIGLMVLISGVMNALSVIQIGTSGFAILIGICAALQICMHLAGREIQTLSHA